MVGGRGTGSLNEMQPGIFSPSKMKEAPTSNLHQMRSVALQQKAAIKVSVQAHTTRGQCRHVPQAFW